MELRSNNEKLTETEEQSEEKQRSGIGTLRVNGEGVEWLRFEKAKRGVEWICADTEKTGLVPRRRGMASSRDERSSNGRERRGEAEKRNSIVKIGYGMARNCFDRTCKGIALL